MRDTRYKLGRLFAQGITKNYEQQYLEFKAEIDAELSEEPVKEIKSKGKK